MAAQTDDVSVREYLATVEESGIRHEYLGGLVYATVSLRSLKLTLPLSAICEGI